MDMMVVSTVVLWLIASGVLVVCELFVPGLFFCLSFATGGVVAAIAAVYGASFALQCGLCVLIAMMQFFGLRFAVARYGQALQYPTNVGALVGKKAVVTRAIMVHGYGLVKVGGEVWVAECDEECEIGCMVHVTKVSGNRLLVKKAL